MSSTTNDSNTSSTNLDVLIQSIVKTNDELEAERLHAWNQLPPPRCCFNNCFTKEEACNKHNRRDIYAEYNYLCQKRKNIRKIMKNKEEKYVNDMTRLMRIDNYYTCLINQCVNKPPYHLPIAVSTLSATPPAVCIPAAISG